MQKHFFRVAATGKECPTCGRLLSKCLKFMYSLEDIEADANATEDWLVCHSCGFQSLLPR